MYIFIIYILSVPLKVLKALTNHNLYQRCIGHADFFVTPSLHVSDTADALSSTHWIRFQRCLNFVFVAPLAVSGPLISRSLLISPVISEHWKNNVGTTPGSIRGRTRGKIQRPEIPATTYPFKDFSLSNNSGKTEKKSFTRQHDEGEQYWEQSPETNERIGQKSPSPPTTPCSLLNIYSLVQTLLWK
jgi:hypothetical protein